MDKMTKAQRAAYEAQRDQEVIDVLDALDIADPEATHSRADELLVSRVSPLVAAAYRRTVERAAWWASA